MRQPLQSNANATLIGSNAVRGRECELHPRSLRNSQQKHVINSIVCARRRKFRVSATRAPDPSAARSNACQENVNVRITFSSYRFVQ